MQLALVFPPSGCIKSASQSVQTCASTTTPLSQLLFWTENLRYRMFFVGRSICPHSHLVSQLWGEKKPHHNANLFKDQLLCQDDSADDILESFNELTIVRNGDDEVAEVKMCASACARLCVCVLIFTTQQEVSEKITSHCHIMSTKTNEQQHTHTDCLQASTPCDL